MINDFPVGYCTNVHAGITLDQAKRNLIEIATQVRQKIALHAPQPIERLPVGLWLAEGAAKELELAGASERFREFLDQQQLKAYTLNGFPQGDFHQPVVKHAVYEPTWRDSARLDYTRSLANVLCRLLDEQAHGSISTLPLGWPHQSWTADDYQRCGEQLRLMADHLHRLLETTGHEITLAIEPEPGCVLDTADDIIQFLNRYVFGSGVEHARRHITVCHDICHSAVMFESQRGVLDAYRREGIRVGKVQVSSAMKVPWSEARDQPHKLERIASQLTSISEPRYLHQTTRLVTKDSTAGAASKQTALEMVDDLPLALGQWLNEKSGSPPASDWRIHFHVPIYTDSFGELRASREDITEVVTIMHAERDARVDSADWFTGDYEVETYAWGVLPAELQVADLAEGIARELLYFHDLSNCRANN